LVLIRAFTVLPSAAEVRVLLQKLCFLPFILSFIHSKKKKSSDSSGWKSSWVKNPFCMWGWRNVWSV